MERIPSNKKEQASSESIGALVKLGYENVKEQRESHEGKKMSEKELSDLHDKEAALALASIIPRVLDQNSEISEKELRIGYGAFRLTPKSGSNQRIWGIYEGRTLSEETIIRSMKAAVIQAAMREVLEVLGEIKVELPKGAKTIPPGFGGYEVLRINLQEILEPKIIAKINEKNGMGVCVGYENEGGHQYSVEGHDSDGYTQRRGVATNDLEGKFKIVQLFSKEEQRDLVLLIQALQEKISISRERDWRTFKAVLDEARYTFVTDAMSGIVSIPGETENEGDLELARAIAQKMELEREVERNIAKIRNTVSKKENDKDKEVENQDVVREKESASIKAKLRISEGYAVELEKKLVAKNRAIKQVHELLRKDSVFNGNKKEALRILKDLLEEG